MTTSVTSSNFDEQFGVPPRTTSIGLEAAIRAQNPSTKYVELDSNGWLLLDVTAERVQAEYLFVDTVAEPSPGQRLDATWQVVRGTQRLTAGGPASAARPDRPAQPPAPRVVPAGGQAAHPGAGRARPAAGMLPATGGARGAAVLALGVSAAAALSRRVRQTPPA